MRREGVLLLLAVGVLWGALSAQRARRWTDEAALWREATVRAPTKPRPWINLGKQAHLAGDTVAAERAYWIAWGVACRPDRVLGECRIGRVLAETNLAILRMDQGRPADAEQLIRLAYGRAPAALTDVQGVFLWITARPGF